MTTRRSMVAHVSFLLVLFVVLAWGVLVAGERSGVAADEESLRSAELAFAKTMADRDHAAFTCFLAEEAVFFGSAGIHRGRSGVAEAWKPLFEGPAAPFSWRPEEVAVLESGNLGLSSGPVTGPDGQSYGTFSSVWQKQEDGSWKVVFDRGCPPCSASE